MSVVASCVVVDIEPWTRCTSAQLGVDSAACSCTLATGEVPRSLAALVLKMVYRGWPRLWLHTTVGMSVISWVSYSTGGIITLM
jgi:hypothetical protein